MKKYPKIFFIVVILFLPYFLDITVFCNNSFPILHSEVLAQEKASSVKETEKPSFLIQYFDSLFPQKSKVQELLKKGDFLQAEKEIKTILDQDPENLKYQKAYAAVLQKNGSYDLSIETYKKIIEKFPRDMDSRIARGRSYLANEDYQTALQDFNYVLDRQKDNVNALKGIEDIEKAIQYKKQLEAKNKNDQFRESNLEKAKSLMKAKSYSQAIEIYSTLINKNKDDLETKIFLARALALNNQITEAKALYKSLKSKGPENVDVLIGEGFLFTKENNNDAAMANFKKALELNKNNEDAIKGINLIKERIKEKRRLVRIKTKNKKILLLLKNVDDLIKKRNYEISEKILTEAFAKYPKNTDIAFKLSKVKFFQKKHKESLKLVNELIAANPQDLDYLFLRGKIFVATNRLEKAELDFRNVLAKDTGNKDASDGIQQIKSVKIQKIADYFKNRKNKFIKSQLANVENYLQKKNYEGAILGYKKILQKYPNVLAVQLNMAKAFTLNSNIEEAESLYSKLIKKFPLNSELLIGQGFLNLRKGELILAQKSFIDAQRVDGTNEDINTGFSLVKERMDKEKIGFFISGEGKKADAFIEQKNFKGAIQVYENLLHKYPGNLDIELDLVRAYRLDSQIVEAEKKIDELIKTYPENADLWVEKGQVYSLKGNQEFSKKSFEKALSLQASNKEIQNRLLRLKKDQEFNFLVEIVKDLEMEEDFITAELQIRKKINEGLTENRVQYLLAQNLRFQKKYKESLEILNELLNQEPENVDYLASRGTVWRILSRVEDAKRDYVKALEKDPQRIDLLLGMGYVSVMEKKFFKGEEYFQTVLKIEPSNPDAKEATVNIENFVKDQIVESFYVETFTGGRDTRTTQNLEWIHPFNSKLRGEIGFEHVYVSDTFDQTGFVGGNYDVYDDLNIRGKVSISPNPDLVANEIYETEVIKSFKEYSLETLALYRYMNFSDTEFHLLSPGIRYYFSEQTSALMRAYLGFQDLGNSRSGFLNIHHQVNKSLITYFGGSMGNETFRIVSGADTRPVDSKAVQAGFKWRISDRFSVGLNYLYQERENQFNRNLFGLVVPVRF